MAVGLADRVRFLGASVAGMTPRERRMLALLGAVLLLVVGGILWYAVSSGLEERSERVALMRQAAEELVRHADELRAAKAARARADARLETSSVPMLQAHVDKIAQEVGLEVKEYKNLKPRYLDKKKRYQERSVRLRILGTDLSTLAKFLDKLERGRDLVMVTELRITARTGQPDKLDVDMVVSTFEKVKAAKAREKGSRKARPRRK